jgi:hypothetical protein
MAKSKGEKLIRSILKDEAKRSMYSKEELTYFELQLSLMKIERKKKKIMTKYTKGFTPICKSGKNKMQENSLTVLEKK